MLVFLQGYIKKQKKRDFLKDEYYSNNIENSVSVQAQIPIIRVCVK